MMLVPRRAGRFKVRPRDGMGHLEKVEKLIT